MASLAEIQALVQRIHDDLPLLVQRSQIAPVQIVVGEGLSDISRKLGLVQAGEFRTGNGLEPGFGFSGVRIGYPPFVYDGELWNIVGVESDVMQIGIRASDGKFVFGGGDGFADEWGLFFKNQEGFLGFQSLTTGLYDDVGMYIDGFDELVLTNKVGLADTGSGIRFDLDRPDHTVAQIHFGADGIWLPDGNVDIAAGQEYLIDGVPHTHGDKYMYGAFLNLVTVPAFTSYWGCPFKGTVDAITHNFVALESGTFSNLNMRIASAQPASGTLDVGLYVQNLPSALAFTVPAGGPPGMYSDNTNTASVTAGNVIRWIFVNNASAASAQLSTIGMLFTADP
jgi:hypothetical protein